MIRSFLAALMAAAVLMACGCATNPVTGKREMHLVSEQQEIQIGQRNYGFYQQAEGGAYVTDPEVVGYVRGVAQKIWQVSDRPNLPYDIVVLNNSAPNAWALPGGKMAINRGLLTELHSEAELAAVLGHETIHIAARHGAKSQERGLGMQAIMLGVGLLAGDSKHQPAIVQGSGLVAGLTERRYDRGAELQADKYGIAYMSRAGYDTQAAVDIQELFLKLAGDPGWLAGILSTHPPSRERIEANKATIQKYAKGGTVGKEAYAGAMAGLMKAKMAYENLDQGQAMLSKNNPAAALALARAAIAIEPREAHFYALAARAQAEQRAYPQALENLGAAIRRNGNYFAYHLDRGQLRYAMGDVPAARADLQQSAALLPTAQAHYLLGMIDLDGGRAGEAREHFRAASTADSSEGERAGVMLAKLEIGEQPERYLQVGYGLDERGFLVVTIRNTSPVDVGACEIGLAAVSTGRWETYRAEKGVPAHLEAKLPTRLGPFANADAARAAVRFRFERVTVAEASAPPAGMRRAKRGR